MTTGIVYLVGAGPGDPGLITVRGLSLLQTAQVVVYDRLANPHLLEHAPKDAELVDAGKGPGNHEMRQEDINALLVKRGLEGKRVVRLKGGDPFLFGRGGEETEALARAGVPFEVVPGVTSAIAVPAYAGIPVTHRKAASSLAIVTGNEDPTKPETAVDWLKLARSTDTIVILMGLGNLPSIARMLVDGGRSASTPIACVERGTEPRQRTVTGTLGDIADKARSAGLAAPVVTIVGDVVRLRDAIAWFDRRPLFGKRVLVTRTRQQASALSGLLTASGASPVEVPTIEVVPPDDWRPVDVVLARLQGFHWVVFTSSNAVDAVLQRLSSMHKDARAFGSAKVCAIGAATADALRVRGITADVIAQESVSEGVVDALRGQIKTGNRVLLPRQSGGREVIAPGLRVLGVDVTEVTAYALRTPTDVRERIRAALAGGIDIATFTSSSTVRNLVDALDGDVSKLKDVVVASIGPVTSATARELGLRVDVEAKEHTVPGLVAAAVEYVNSRKSANSP
jgi:uroporphyrinogen III methyltransferase/synthase